MDYKVTKTHRIEGQIEVAGDKSISHRSAIIGALAEGDTVVSNYLMSEDCIHTIEILKSLGVKIEIESNEPNKNVVRIHGRGVGSLQEPEDVLYVGNSGTSLRLLAGVLAGCDFYSVLNGDSSIRRRPMDRITTPLRLMGASVDARSDGKYAPVTIRGGNLKAISYESPVASAQVKSCILLAGLAANESTRVIEPYKSRDHTENMISAFGGDIEISGRSVSIIPNKPLRGRNIKIPGDISSSAFFIVAALCIKGSHLTIKNVGLNPTRTGILKILKNMGASIEIANKKLHSKELVGDIIVKHSKLFGVEVSPSEIPGMIDEIPILAIAGLMAEGQTIIHGLEELKSKESDRLSGIADVIRKLAGVCSIKGDTLIINGPTLLKECTIDSKGDHRMAMCAAVSGLIGDGVVVKGAECINTSFPTFFNLLRNVRD